MKFEIRNVNKIKKAEIDLDGLTVIVGENSSGKSTIGRLLYSTIQAVKNSELKNDRESFNKLIKHIDSLYVHISSLRKNDSKLQEIFPLPLNKFLIKLNDSKSPFDYIEDCRKYLGTKEISPRERALIFSDLQSMVITLKKTDKDWSLASEIQYLVESEFENRINSNNSDISLFRLTDKDNIISSFITNNSLDRFDIEGRPFIQDATYIESPLYLHVLDSLLMSAPYREQLYKDNIRPMAPYHILDFALKINSLKYVNSKNCENKLCKTFDINSIINGRFEFDMDLNKIVFVQNNKQFEPINVASGIKSFGIIEMLLEGDYINENKMLIWDEPENHLHPEWQIKFANLLVNLSNNGIPILVTTHSPYFLQALRYYSSMYGIEKFVNYYSPSEKCQEYSIFENVTGNLNKVFSRLANPLNEIMNVDEVRNSMK